MGDEKFNRSEVVRLMRVGMEAYLLRDTGGPRDSWTMNDGWRAMTTAGGGATDIVYHANETLTLVLARARRTIGTNINTPPSRWNPEGFKREARAEMDAWEAGKDNPQ